MTLIRRFLGAALAGALITTANAQSTKIATVDMQELFRQYHRTAEAQKQINLERTRIQKENKELLAPVEELKTKMQELQARIEAPSTDDAQKQELFEKEWRPRQEEFMRLERSRNEFIRRQNQALNEAMVDRMKSILQEISEIVQEQAKADGYVYVFDKSGLSTSQVPFLLYTKDATDITAALLKSLNKDAPAESTPSEDTTAPAPSDEAPGDSDEE